jgi:hypothetical protein
MVFEFSSKLIIFSKVNDNNEFLKRFSILLYRFRIFSLILILKHIFLRSCMFQVIFAR